MSVETDDKEKIKNHGLSSKIPWAFERYDFYTKEASKIARQLAFSEGVIFWAIYLIMTNKPRALIIAFYSALLLFFIFDLIQYLFGAYHFEAQAQMMKKIKKLNPDNQINYEIGDEIGKSIQKFFILKLLCLSISSLILIIMFTLFIVN
jgi:hypothetical protein